MEAALGTGVIRVLYCSFHCGAKSDDKCPERGAEYLLRWGKGDTSRLPNGCPYGAENDYYCERVYQAAWKVKYPDRKAFQTKLAKDKALLDAFKADVETYKEARIAGTTWDSKAAKVRLSTIEAKDVRYIKPRDSFYPLKLYRDCCKEGKWTKKERKDHKLDEQDGAQGYLVPNPDGAKLPWEVETSNRFTTQKTTIEAEVEEDMQQSINAADRGFAQLVKRNLPKKRGLARGLSNASAGSAKSSQSPKPRGVRQQSKLKDKSKNVESKDTIKAKAKAKVPNCSSRDGGAGRPPKDIHKYCISMTDGFKTAAEDSIYFHIETSHSTERAIKRCVHRLNEVIEDTTGDEKMVHQEDRKTFQVMVEAMKIYRLKFTVQNWHVKVLSAYEELLTFMLAGSEEMAWAPLQFPVAFHIFRLQAASGVSLRSLISQCQDKSLQENVGLDREAFADFLIELCSRAMCNACENNQSKEACRQDLASMLELLDVEQLGQSHKLQILQFVSVIAPQCDGLRERVEKELGMTVPPFRQQAIQVLETGSENSGETDLLRELARLSGGKEIISIGSDEALHLSKLEDGIVELKALHASIKEESGRITETELSEALSKYNQLAAVASATDPRFKECSDAFSMQLKESMTKVWTTISSEGCSIVKDFCERILNNTPFNPAQAVAVLRQIDSFPPPGEWPFIAQENASKLQETLYGMKKWLAHPALINDAYQDKLDDKNSAIMLDASAPSIFMKTFDAESAVTKVAHGIRNVALKNARKHAEVHVQSLREAFNTVKDAPIVKFDGCKTTCLGNDWDDEKQALVETALKSEGTVMTTLQFYENPQLLQKADGVVRLLKFYYAASIFAKNLPATLEEVSVEAEHKAIDDFSPVLKATNSLAMFLKANERDIQVCGDTNGYFREAIDFKAKIDELMTWSTDATSKMSKGVVDESQHMINEIEATLPERAKLESPDAMTSVSLQGDIQRIPKKTLTDLVATATKKRNRIAEIQAILAAGVDLKFDGEGLKDTTASVKACIANLRFAVAVQHCIEKLKLIDAASDPKSKGSIAGATLKDIEEHKLKPPTHFMERLRSEKQSGL